MAVKRHSLIFSVDSVRAYQARKKSQTRRVVDVKRIKPVHWGWTHANIIAAEDLGDRFWRVRLQHDGGDEIWSSPFVCPFGQAGDDLWVREPIRLGAGNRAQYVADNLLSDRAWPGGKKTYRLARWMPEVLCRYELDVLAVRMERLQSITDDDARAEGVDPVPYRENQIWIAHPDNGRRHVKAYERAWNHLNDARGFGWTVDPWIWVVTFRDKEKAA